MAITANNLFLILFHLLFAFLCTCLVPYNLQHNALVPNSSSLVSYFRNSAHYTYFCLIIQCLVPYNLGPNVPPMHLVPNSSSLVCYFINNVHFTYFWLIIQCLVPYNLRPNVFPMNLSQIVLLY